MNAMKVDLDLVRKYNVPGPRYTSYPPATRFAAEFPREELLAAIGDNARTIRDLSLYFHLPFCRSLCWFCGCTTVITTRQNQSARYISYLKKEMELALKGLNSSRTVKQLHFGGGTPTFLLPEEIRDLGRFIRSRFNVAPDVEAGVEVDPRRLTQEHVAALREAGFQRASLGVQDHNPDVQEAVHRIQPLEMTRRAVEWLRAAGFTSINIDLMYGLPNQTAQSFGRTIDEVLGLDPNRLAVFSYAHVPWIKPSQKILETAVLPTADAKLELLKLSIEKLTAAGFVYIGMDHFARSRDELAVAQRKKTLQRNFQGYSTHGGADIYGFGMSSISQAEDIYWQNEKDLPAYYAALDQGKLPLARGYLLTGDDQVRRNTIMRLMCDLELNYAALSKSMGIVFPEYFESELASLSELEEDGLLKMDRNGVKITETGRLFIRNIAMRFDAYLPAETERRFSRTI